MDSTYEKRREFQASYQQYKDFVASNLWVDLQAELHSWIDDLHDYLENETNEPEMYRFQGRLQACRQLLTLPDRIMGGMEVAYSDTDKQEALTTLDLVESTNLGDDYYLGQLQRWAEEDVENE